MRGVICFLLGLSIVIAIAVYFHIDDMQRMQRDFQAYQRQSLLPEDMK